MQSKIITDKMPAKRRTGGPASIASAQNDEESYKEKRKKNNDAVKKTRAKSKDEASERRRNIDKLRQENERFIGENRCLKKNIETLKDLILCKVPIEEREQKIQEILNAKSEDKVDNS